MAMLSATDRARVREIGEGLRTPEHGSLCSRLPDIRELVGLDHACCARVVLRTGGWLLDRIEIDNFPNSSKLKQRVRAYIQHAHRELACLDLLDPGAWPAWPGPGSHPNVRDIVLDQLDDRAPADFERTQIYREVLRPLGLHRHRVLGAVLCDAPSSIVWFGGLHSQPITDRQRRLLAAVLPLVQRHLAIERRISDGGRVSTALQLLLETIGMPALIVGKTGQIHEVNRAARDLLATQWTEVHSSLRSALARRAGELPFELTSLPGRGAAECLLAVLRPRTSEARLVQAIAQAASRWKLSPRQRRVLDLVLRGETNTAIAVELGIGDRAVELHVTALLDRAGVENRASLIAAVLLGS